MKRNQRGFTLMELMVVIVIVAILAAVAVPLYTNYVKDAQRTEAKGAIGAIVSAEQVYLQRYSTFKAPLANVAAVETDLRLDLSEAKQNWNFSVASDNPLDGFTITATGVTGKTTAGLTVTYKHSRTSGPEWTES